MSTEGPRHRIRERPPKSDAPAPERDSIPTFQTDMREFEGLDVLQQLRRSFSVTINPDIDAEEKRVLRSKAIVNALETDPMDRDDLGIHIVAIGELNEKGRVQAAFPEWSCYSIYAVFPFDENTSHFVAATNFSLRDELPEDASIDQVVNYQADGIREETLFEKQKRLIWEIKAIDAGISRRIQMLPHQGEQKQKELNSWKSIKILEYLQTSLDLQEEYPELTMDFFNVDKDETGRIRVEMRQVVDKAMRRRLEVASTDSSLAESAREYSTGIDVAHLLKDYRAFIADPSSVPDSVEISAGICRILGISARDDDPEGTQEIKIVDKDLLIANSAKAEDVEHADEVLDEATDGSGQEVPEEPATVIFVSPTEDDTSRTPITNAERRRRKKQRTKTKNWPSDNTTSTTARTQPAAIGNAASSTSVPTPGKHHQKQGARSHEFQPVSFDELTKRFGLPVPETMDEVEQLTRTAAEYISSSDGTISVLDELRYVSYIERHSSSKERGKANTIIRKALQLSKAERKEQGILVMTTGKEHVDDPFYQQHPDLLQYQVHVLFSSGNSVDILSSDRRGLTQVTYPKQLEDMVKNADEPLTEFTTDRYTRLLSELYLINELIQERKAEPDSMSNPELRSQLRESRALEKSILLTTLQTAAQLQGEFSLNSLYYYREGATREQTFASFRQISDANLAQRLLGITADQTLQVKEYLPEIAITIRKMSDRQRARKGDTALTDDTLLSDMLTSDSRRGLPRYEDDIPPELREFASMPLEDQLKKTHIDMVRSQDKAREGQHNKALSTAERRILMRNILEATADERKRLGIKIMVVGPEKDGRIAITDDLDLSAYTIYVTYPYGSEQRRYFFDDTRRYLARNPYTNAVPTMEELLVFDNAVNVSGAKIYSEDDDHSMKYNHQISALMHAENRIKEIKDASPTDAKAQIDAYAERKLPYVLAYLTLALQLQDLYSEPLFELSPTSNPDIMDLFMHPLDDLTLKDYLIGQISAADRRIQRRRTFDGTPINSHKLLALKRDYESGKNTSETAKIATAIVDVLGREDTVVV